MTDSAESHDPVLRHENGTDSSPSQDALLAHIFDEILERRRQGEQPDVEAYAQRYPAMAQTIRQAAEALCALTDESDDANTQDFMPPDTRTIGDFQLIRQIGRGGMGIVYEAEQRSMGRRVALKVLPFAGLADSRTLQRFKNEVLAAASLNHPSIVQVHSIGEAEGGLHYYSMQLIRGQSLARLIHELRRLDGNETARQALTSVMRCASRDQSTPTPDSDGEDTGWSVEASDAAVACEHSCAINHEHRDGDDSSTVLKQFGDSAASGHRTRHYWDGVASLAIQVAEALHYAHDRMIVHRDIKPGNILVNADGRAFVADFGLAKMATETSLTMSGDIVGTLRYMAPEQSHGNTKIVDHRADVYSLGATLYELLCLQPAIAGHDAKQIMRRVLEEVPVNLRRVEPTVPHDLATIVAKCLEKDPTERYSSAQHLADDLKRFVKRQPILAKKPNIAHCFSKYIQRNPKSFLGTLIGAVGLMLVLVLGLAWHNRMLFEKNEELRAHKARITSVLASARMREAMDALARGDTALARKAANEIRELAAELTFGFEWKFLNRTLQQSEPLMDLSDAHDGPVSEIVVNARNGQIVSVGHDGVARIWNGSNGNLLASLDVNDGELNAVAISPDGSTLAVASKRVGFWNLTDCEFDRWVTFNENDAPASMIESLAFSPDGAWIAIGRRYEAIELVSVNGGIRHTLITGTRQRTLSFSRDGKQLFGNRESAPKGPRLGVCWQITEDGPEVAREFGEATNHASIQAIRPLESDYAVCADITTGVLQMFDVRSGKLADSALLAGESHCFSLAVSTRGDFVAAGYSNGVVRSFAISKIGGVPRIVGEHIFTAHVGAVNSLCFISDGRLATCGDDGGIRIWPPFDGAYAAAGPDHITLQSIQLAARSAQDLRAVVHSYPEQKIWIGDVSQDQWKELSLPASPTHAAFHPHHPIVYYGTASGQVVAIDETTTKINRITRLGAEGVTWLHLTSNGRRIVAVLPRGRDDTAQIVVLDAETLAELRRADLPGHPLCAAISPTGHQIAYGGQEKNQIFIVDLATLDVEQEIEASHVVRAVHWQTAVELVSGYQDGTLTVWDVRSAKPIRTLVGHRGCIRSITSSPDGRTLVTTADDGTVRLWRIRDGVYLGTLVDHQRPLGFSSAAFSKDGHFLAVTRLDPTQPKNILLFRFGPNTRQLRRTVR